MDLGLAQRSVLVTGGAGGIGSAAVRALAAEGARVVIHFHSSEGPARALAEETGGTALRADLRDEAQVEALFDAAGPLDGCVANAGVWPREDVAVADMPLERWRSTLDGNLTATFLTARAFLRRARGEDPALVLVSSTAGRFGEAGHADYAAAKAAITHGLALSLKNEIVGRHPRGRVNVVAPGWTVSPMTEGELTDQNVARATATMALRKVAVAEDIARAIAYLLSPVAAGHLTGEVLTVAGGMEGRLLHPPGA
jgi:3-oxoacyl-[acyl-carrier protein] reductase